MSMCFSPDGNALLPKISSYLGLNTWAEPGAQTLHSQGTTEDSADTRELFKQYKTVTCDFCEAILYHIISESINSLGFQNQDFGITSSLELIKTLSSNNFSRQVSLVYWNIHAAIFTFLAWLPGWEHQHQLYVFILSHSSMFLPSFLHPAAHRAAFLPSGV